jgi:hypothetical protein
MERTKNERSSSGVHDALNDSWFGRNVDPSVRAIAAQLRARLCRGHQAEAILNEDGSLTLAPVAQPGLDDSWFK